MNATATFLSAAALLAGSVLFLPFAAGQDREGSDGPARAELAPQAGPDSAVSARVKQLEAARRSAREAGIKDPAAWTGARPQRAAQHRRELAELWGNVVGTLDAQAGLRMHADRMARLNRLLDLAQAKSDDTLAGQIKADISREIARYDRVMQVLRAGSGQ